MSLLPFGTPHGFDKCCFVCFLFLSSHPPTQTPTPFRVPTTSLTFTSEWCLLSVWGGDSLWTLGPSGDMALPTTFPSSFSSVLRWLDKHWERSLPPALIWLLEPSLLSPVTPHWFHLHSIYMKAQPPRDARTSLFSLRLTKMIND